MALGDGSAITPRIASGFPRDGRLPTEFEEVRLSVNVVPPDVQVLVGEEGNADDVEVAVTIQIDKPSPVVTFFATVDHMGNPGGPPARGSVGVLVRDYSL